MGLLLDMLLVKPDLCSGVMDTFFQHRGQDLEFIFQTKRTSSAEAKWEELWYKIKAPQLSTPMER